MAVHPDSFGTRATFFSKRETFDFFSLSKLADAGYPGIHRMPFSIRVLLEAVLRNENGREVTADHIDKLARYNPRSPGNTELPFKPARVLLQDFTGVPCVVDLAAMRNAMARFGGDPALINPELAVNLVIDHSIQVDFFNRRDAIQLNSEMEFRRNRERYEFLRWGEQAFENFQVVPPASGICHQVNLEYLGQVVRAAAQETSGTGGERRRLAYFDSLVGTDSHTPMINGLGILGWGVGGIEAEAAMLGQPVFMLAPPVVGVKLTGRLGAGITATDLVLTVTEMLRRYGVVGKFVEFFGPGLSGMTVPDRATISNMAPEYGATVGYFPIDRQTLDYLYATGRPVELIERVEAYAKEQHLFRTDETPDPEYEDALELDLSTVEASIAGPKRPQDRISLADVPGTWRKSLETPVSGRGFEVATEEREKVAVVTLDDGTQTELRHGDVAIAAITSCTNTSNPSVLLAAGLVAKKAIEAGLRTKPYVKTSFAPGSMVVTEYLKRTGLMSYLEALGFYLVGYGCTTCIGNSGPLPEPIARAVEEHNLVVAGVLSGNRNFEGRINPHTKANFLASPPLVVAYALAGNVGIDLTREPIGYREDGSAIRLADLWPSEEELSDYVKKALDREAFLRSYEGLETSNEQWNSIRTSGSELYRWDENSTYIREPAFFTDMNAQPEPISSIEDARVLVWAGDSTTTDHISPAGAIDADSPAGRYLISRGIERKDFNSYGSRRGNHEVMVRGTFANIRFRNLLAPGTEGSATTYLPTGEVTDIYEAAMRYREQETPTVVLGGKDYGMGSSRDWAAKGPYLLGIRAVIAESFERIHRSNLVGMGILPLEFRKGETAEALGLEGSEIFSIRLDDDLVPGQEVEVTARKPSGGETLSFRARCRIDSPVEVEYYRNGGILHTVLRKFMARE
ncbi:MAG: aconitate hydratase AcnA [Spirochaetaceae bacterium]